MTVSGRRPALGEEGFDVFLADTARDRHIILAEFDEVLAVHRLVELVMEARAA